MSADDQRLIAECLQGNTDAFGVLVRRHQERLYNSVYRLVGNAEDAQDVIQEAFLKAYQALDGFQGDSLFFTWLYRIAINTAISHKRKHRVVARWETGCDVRKTTEPFDPSAESRPERALERAEQEARVRQALARLSPEHRAVLILKELEEHSYETMAEILQVPLGTIRSRLHRARLELRELLEKSERSEG